jgi:NADPH:quinone reductase-like Zn-dependent oxidoreductase
MRAAVFERFGDADVLDCRDVPAPTPGAGEVLVRVTAAGLNQFDHQVRRGAAGFPIPLPFVGGMEAVGVVEEVGEGVVDWSPGQRVLRDVTDSCGRCRHCRSGRAWRCVEGAFTLGSISGGFAELLACRSSRLVSVPAEIDDTVAASVQMSYGTAWHMLHARARVRSGDIVLVSSVGSGLGAAAADIAKLAGARVIATASTDEKLAAATARGVDEVINHARADVAGEVMRLTGGVGVDIAFEHVGGKAFRAALDSLAMDGRLVTCGWTAETSAAIDLMDLCRGRKEIIGSVNRTLGDLHRCLELVAAGRLEPAVAATFPLERIRDAVALAESRISFGKIVITL